MLDKRPDALRSYPVAVRETIRLTSEIDKAILKWPVE